MRLDSSCCRLTFAPPPRFAAPAMIHRPTTNYYTLLLTYLLQTPPLHSYTPSSRPDQITLAKVFCVGLPAVRLDAWTWSSVLYPTAICSYHQLNTGCAPGCVLGQIKGLQNFTMIKNTLNIGLKLRYLKTSHTQRFEISQGVRTHLVWVRPCLLTAFGITLSSTYADVYIPRQQL